MKRFLNKLQYVRPRDVAALFLFLVALPCACVFRRRHRKLWLICESGGEARDNGYWLFRYLCQEHPEQEAAFVIDLSSADYEKVRALGKVVPYGGLTHWIYYLAAEKNISSQKDGKPNAAACYLLEVYGILKNTRVFLQHGVTLSDGKWLYYQETKMRLFVCGAKPEYDFICERFGYPDGFVQYLGFCRFDGLHQIQVKPHQILVMPSWRQWLNHKVKSSYELDDVDDFTKTEYFLRWNGFLNHPALHQFLETNQMELLFYPHRNVQANLSYFRTDCSRITLASWTEHDLQQLLKESAVMITDYSSVAIDFAYMKKPTLYYQFDEEKFRRGQYAQGYFDYREGFGPVCTEPEQLLSALANMLRDGSFVMEALYRDRVEGFFPLYDTDNCRRNFEAIQAIGKGDGDRL